LTKNGFFVIFSTKSDGRDLVIVWCSPAEGKTDASD